MDFTPWERYPALTVDRLIVIGGALRMGRDSAVEDYKPSKGDDPWTLGCTAYKRSCFNVKNASHEHSWLTILPEDNNRFTFAVAGVPMKFYHGLKDDPTSKTLNVSSTEFANIQMSFDFGNFPDKERFLRLAVTTGPDLTADTVTLVELSAGNVTGLFEIPRIGGAGVLTMTPKPIDPGPPSLTPIAEEEQNTRGNTKTGTEGNVR